MSDISTKSIKGKLIFIATATLDFEVPADTPDDQLQAVLSVIMEKEDPVEKLKQNPNVEYLRWLALQGEDDAFVVMPAVDFDGEDIMGGELEDAEIEDDEDEEEEVLNKIIETADTQQVTA